MKVLFEGRVQGVGFRHTTCRLAAMFDVTGQVCNLMDGNVELIAEGTTDELRDFLNEIRASRLGRYITREHASWSEPSGSYGHFGIHY